MRNLISILLTSFFILNFSEASICESLKEDTPVLAGGRVKPYLVLAKESIKFLTGKSKINDEPVTSSFCKIVSQVSTHTSYNIPILVEHIKTKELLGLNKDQTFLMADQLVEKKDLVKSEIFKTKENNSYKKDLNKLYARIDLYEKINNAKALSIYTGKESENELKGWQSFDQLVEKKDFEKIITLSKDKYISEHDNKFLYELTYTKLHLFGYALLLVLLALSLAVLSKNLKWSIAATLLLVALEMVAMTFRIIISGRAPITNMYETVMFSGFGALVISLLILIFRKEKVFLLAGLSYNMLCLFMINFANDMLDSSISPLVPVLRDNFWLSTHVTTIILSYAALALSWIAANIALYKIRFGAITKKEYRFHQDLVYTCIKVGIVLLSAGIILGGVWADYSWGRFWGWDPKETWSLIVLLFYMVLVHGKYSSWINTHRFVILSAAGFMTVMMAWFGVNYILASGLHSYGFSEGGAIFLGTFFLVQTIYIIVCSKQSFKES